MRGKKPQFHDEQFCQQLGLDRIQDSSRLKIIFIVEKKSFLVLEQIFMNIWDSILQNGHFATKG